MPRTPASPEHVSPAPSPSQRVGRPLVGAASGIGTRAAFATTVLAAMVGVGLPLLASPAAAVTSPTAATPAGAPAAVAAGAKQKEAARLAAAASAAATFPSSRLADLALTYVGKDGSKVCQKAHQDPNGQCKQVVNCLIILAGGYSAADGSDDYAGSFLKVGGREVTEETAQRGDIVQWGSGTTSAKHTAIVVSNLGNHTFDLVDSNWVRYETVGHHVFKNINKKTLPSPRFIRVGTDGSEAVDEVSALATDTSMGPLTMVFNSLPTGQQGASSAAGWTLPLGDLTSGGQSCRSGLPISAAADCPLSTLATSQSDASGGGSVVAGADPGWRRLPLS